METSVVSDSNEGPPMVHRELLRSGRKAFLRGDWSKAKRRFLEVLDGPATEEEKDVARKYLHQVYLLEARATKATRRAGGPKARPAGENAGPRREASHQATGAPRPSSTPRGSKLKKTWLWNFMRFGKSR